MENFSLFDKEKITQKLQDALKYYGLDQEYPLDKIREKMLVSGQPGLGSLTAEISSKANFNSLDEANRFLRILSNFSNISPKTVLGGLSPMDVIKWQYHQKIELIGAEQYASTRLLQDSISFLTYIKNSQIVLTQTLKELKRKDIHNLNSLLVVPDEIDHKIGDKIFRLNSEVEAQTIHFIKYLVLAAHLIKQRLGKITMTDKGERFIRLAPVEQFQILFETWLYRLNWAFLTYFDEDFITSIQDKGSLAIFRLAILLDIKKKVSVGDFSQLIFAMVKTKIDEKDPHNLCFQVERTILARLEYFSLLDRGRELKSDNFPYQLRSENNEYLSSEFGRKFLNNFVSKTYPFVPNKSFLNHDQIL
jgi:hypothetical protein